MGCRSLNSIWESSREWGKPTQGELGCNILSFGHVLLNGLSDPFQRFLNQFVLEKFAVVQRRSDQGSGTCDRMKRIQSARFEGKGLEDYTWQCKQGMGVHWNTLGGHR